MKEDMIEIEKWIDLYARQIERFACQYGCSPVQAAQLAEETFRVIYNDEVKIDEGKLIVYKIALERLGHIKQLTPMLESPMPFEEDAAFHSQIVKLATVYSVPLVLQEYHALSVEEIAGVMTIPVDEVEANIKVAKVTLQEAIGNPSAEIVERRLKFLGKSYNRLPLLFNVAKVVRQEESVQVTKKQKKLGRKGWMTAIILGVLLVGLIGSPYFTDEDWELRSDRKYIEELKKEFADQVADKQKILGVSDEVVNQIPFIAVANMQITQLVKGLEDKNSKGKKIDRQLAEDWLLMLTEVMKLPSELADELFAAPLVNNIEKSMIFAEAYFIKVDEVKYTLYDAFAEEYNGIHAALETGLVDAGAILAQRDVYDERTIQAVQAITSQHIELIWNEETAWRDGNSEFIARLRAALHESAGSYLTQYERQPFMLDDRLIYSLDDTIKFIKEMEQTIISVKRSQWDVFTVEGTMVNLLEAIVQGKTMEEFNNSDGSISDVHRNAWRELALLGADSGVGVMMTKIVEEMEASNWQYSDFHNSLKDYRTYEAYSFASRGQLEQFNAQPFEENVTYNDKIFNLPNAILDNTVEDLYDEFSVAYDRTILTTIHPLFIVGLFYYANEKGDSAMMWHLTDPDSRTSSIEEYTAEEIALLEIMDSIRFTPSMIMTNMKTTTAPIEFERNGKSYYNVWMTYATDQVWQIESIVIEEGSL